MSLKFYRASNLFYDPPSRLRQTWRAGKNQLVKVTKPSGDTVEYTYDGEGNRYSKTVNGTTRYYHYDASGNIVSESDSNKNILVKYVRDNSSKVVSIIQGNNTYYFVYDGTGNVTAVTDSSGSTVAYYLYDEFGNINASTGEVYNPIKYQGENNAYYDEETGLYKIGLRYYDSKVGRWLTKDTNNDFKEESQRQNKYSYVENNPINRYDYTGEASKKRGKYSVRVSWSISMYDCSIKSIKRIGFPLRFNYFRHEQRVIYKNRRLIKNQTWRKGAWYGLSGWRAASYPYSRAFTEHNKRVAGAESQITLRNNYIIPFWPKYQWPNFWRNKYHFYTRVSVNGGFVGMIGKRYRLTSYNWTSKSRLYIKVNGRSKVPIIKKLNRWSDGPTKFRKTEIVKKVIF